MRRQTPQDQRGPREVLADAPFGGSIPSCRTRCARISQRQPPELVSSHRAPQRTASASPVRRETAKSAKVHPARRACRVEEIQRAEVSGVDVGPLGVRQEQSIAFDEPMTDPRSLARLRRAVSVRARRSTAAPPSMAQLRSRTGSYSCSKSGKRFRAGIGVHASDLSFRSLRIHAARAMPAASGSPSRGALNPSKYT